MPKIVINHNCIGCGMCVSVNPNIFKLGDEGTAQVIAGQEENCKDAGEAIEMCPVRAIGCDKVEKKVEKSTKKKKK